MAQQHLQELLTSYPDIDENSDELRRNHGIDLFYFWDEARVPHLGQGWLVEYIILGVSIGVGIAATSFLKSYFEKAGEAAWQATVELFRNAARKLRRKRMFFFVAAPLKHARVTLLLDERSLSDEDLLRQSYTLYGKLIQLAEKDDEFTTTYCKGPLLIKYDTRCSDFMIYPCGFEIEHDHPITSRYAWLLADQPDGKSFARLDNLFLIRAILHRSLREYSESFVYFEKALATNPGNASVYLEMGATHFRQGNFQSAIDCWKELEQIPGSLMPGQGIEDIYVGYCQMLYEQGDAQEADAAFRLGLARLPERGLTKLYIEYSHVLQMQGKVDDALDVLKEGVKRVSPGSKDFTSLESEYTRLSTSKSDRVAIIQEPGYEQLFNEGSLIRILFLAANPSDTTRLRLDKEIREIDLALRQAQFRDRFKIEQHWAVRVSDLQGYLLRHKPDIVHFSGHGSESNEIILEDDLGNSQPVSARALSRLFSVLKDNIRCVVLNAFYSEPQAQAIADHVDCVVGMSKTIGDSAAISFATAFYQALGYGKSIRTAFDLGCNQIDLANLGHQDVPKLLAIKGNPEMIAFICG